MNDNMKRNLAAFEQIAKVMAPLAKQMEPISAQFKALQNHPENTVMTERARKFREIMDDNLSNPEMEQMRQIISENTCIMRKTYGNSVVGALGVPSALLPQLKYNNLKAPMLPDFSTLMHPNWHAVLRSMTMAFELPQPLFEEAITSKIASLTFDLNANQIKTEEFYKLPESSQKKILEKTKKSTPKKRKRLLKRERAKQLQRYGIHLLWVIYAINGVSQLPESCIKILNYIVLIVGFIDSLLKNQ